MKKSTKIIAALLMVFMLIIGIGFAQTQKKSDMGRGKAKSSEMQNYPMMGMQMMKKAGMPDEMMNYCQTIMKTPVFMDSPCAIYGQDEKLKLTDTQKKKLIEIEKEARQKTLSILTPEQRKLLGKVSAKPMTMMQICGKMRRQMMKMMQDMKGDKGMTCPMQDMKGDKGMTCPMQDMKGDKGMTCPMQDMKGDKGMTCPMQDMKSDKGMTCSMQDMKGDKGMTCSMQDMKGDKGMTCPMQDMKGMMQNCPMMNQADDQKEKIK